MQNFRKKMKNNKGFSLVELIIVIAILAILVGILAPQYLKYIDRSRRSTDVAAMDSFVSAAKVAAGDIEYPNSTVGGVNGANLLGNTYTINMTEAGTTVTATGGNNTDLNAAFIEALGDDWATRSMQANGWDFAGGTTGTLTAEVAISDEGSVTVTLTPTEFAGYGRD